MMSKYFAHGLYSELFPFFIVRNKCGIASWLSEIGLGEVAPGDYAAWTHVHSGSTRRFAHPHRTPLSTRASQMTTSPIWIPHAATTTERYLLPDRR